MAVQNRLKPNSRVNRGTQRTSVITVLPAEGCTLPIPTIPAGRDWSEVETERWDELWQSPQATQWDDSATGQVAMLIVYEQAIFGNTGSAWMAQEARHISDALGLTPKAMVALGWTVENPS